MSGDIYDSFTRPDALCSCDDPRNPACISPGNHCSVLYIINKIAPYADRGQPGGWNDMDMLEVGNGGMTDDEVRGNATLCTFRILTPIIIIVQSTFLHMVSSQVSASH
jgi:alpha-galactosidase